jgi:sterol desaturase/sphingolipid hydroxylase (fatty acid hydroxylase superfamily)
LRLPHEASRRAGSETLNFGTNLLGGILSPVFDLAWSSSSKVYWLYLCSAIVIAVLVYLRTADAPSLRGAFAFLAPRSVVGHRSAFADYKIWLVNGFLLIAIFFPYFSLSTLTAANATKAALGAITGGAAPAWPVSWGTMAAYTICDLLAIDAALFLAHYLQHKVPLLWEFHKTHHSAEVLTPITVLRMHPVDQLLNFTLAAALPGFMAGVFSYLYAQPVPVFAVSGLNIGLFVFYLAGVPLRHSHIWLMYPRWIARHISSPAMHLIHHSSETRHADKNLAQMFNFWDKLAGTFYLPNEKEVFELGLSAGEGARFRTLGDLYLQPFRNVWTRAAGLFASREGAAKPR